jgi:hypothetical protein
VCAEAPASTDNLQVFESENHDHIRADGWRRWGPSIARWPLHTGAL